MMIGGLFMQQFLEQLLWWCWLPSSSSVAWNVDETKSCMFSYPLYINVYDISCQAIITNLLKF